MVENKAQETNMKRLLRTRTAFTQSLRWRHIAAAFLVLLSPLVAFGEGGLISSGTAIIPGTFSFDFDAGTVGNFASDPGMDVFWEQITSSQRQMAPRSSAGIVNLGVVDFSTITAAFLQGLTYGTSPINGNDDASNQLVLGDIFAVRTSAGNYAKVKVLTYGYNLEVQWVTLARVQLLANYTFDVNGLDCTGNSPPIELRNTTITNGTLCLNGIYEGGNPDGFHAVATITGFSYESFTVALDFFAADYSRDNILTGGSSYRWFSLRHNAGRLEVTLNNQALVYLLSDSQLKTNEWQSVLCSVDASARKIITALNGQRLGDISLSSDFHFEVIGSPAESTDRLFTFANYSSGSAFHGYADNLKVWGRALGSSEIDGMLSSPTLNIQRAIIVSWPKFPAGYVLRCSANVSGPYQDYTGSIFTEANQINAVVPFCVPQKFFQLVRP